MIFEKTVGLDRDGTINRDLGTYITTPDDFFPIPGSLDAIAMIRNKGYNVVILTNQAGIMKKIMTPEDVDAVHQRLLELLGKVGCRTINGIYYSTSNLKEDLYAKPNIGMFKRAEVELRVKFKGGYYVGDKISDLKAADKIHATPVLVQSGYGEETTKKLNTFANRTLKKKTQVFTNLWAFAESLPDAG